MKKRKKIIIKKTIVKKYNRKRNTKTPIHLPLNLSIKEDIWKDIEAEPLFKLNQRISLSDRVKNGEKISIIVACMNRYKNLRMAVENWITYDELHEIIILDYGSKNSLEETLLHKLSDKIKLYRTNTDHWHLTRAYNIAAQYATGDILLKMDADYMIMPNFFSGHKLSYNSFIYGGGGVGGLYGFICLYKNPFFLLNGYNERIINYGHDDKDLFLRCQYVAGMGPIKINKKLLYHIPHSEYEKIANQKNKENKFRSIMRNMRVAKKDPWSNKDTMTPKDVAFRII